MAGLPLDAAFLGLALTVLVLAGTVKGLIGIGLPLITIPALSFFVGVPQAIAIMSLPILVTNGYQAFTNRELPRVARRFWPLLITLMAGVVLGASLLVTLDERTLYTVLGLAVITFGLVNLVNPSFRLPSHSERWLAPPIGFGAGVLGGLSNFFGPPIVLYLVALKLPREAFVAAVGLAFFVGALPLYSLLIAYDVYGWAEAAASLAAVLPVLCGVKLGERLRQRVPQDLFRLLVLGLLVVIGLSLLRRAWL
ncbi:sulfite exporter TauE/SafE family protein [Algihabitans albus]|uniref:sulfite exporter TauE/SafE family protein n=1 Tax=Algihabitans albus TaxID=2164067 RepID=UPI000E5D44F5|nr:sulfite exporter TauE/SafE family protein [Algihabitans albus]